MVVDSSPNRTSHTPAIQFCCPLCQSPLVVGEKLWQCRGDNPQQRQHCFDVARQGYINLLPVQQKNSKHPGDSEAAVAARQRFLQAGFYQPLQEALADFCTALLPRGSHPNWLDIGCGEGYYTERLLTLAPTNLVALDISKPAVMATAKRLRQASAANPTPSTCRIYTLVASASQVPLASRSVDVISSIFSPILPKEFHRLLSDKGFVVVAKPAANHLLELRAGLFEQVVAHDSDKFIDTLAPYMSLVKQITIANTIALDAKQLSDLLTMTPYAYRAQPARREALLHACEQAGTLSVTTQFVIYGFQKNQV